MGATQTTIQRYLRASCVNCGDTKQFHLVDGDSAAAVAVLACDTCGHQIEVHLDP